MIDRLFESLDLRTTHLLLSLAGFFITVYVMQLTHWEAEDDVDPPYIRNLRRISLALLAWSMLWSLSYQETKNWQPWPPEILMILALDMIMFIRALAIKARIKRTGVKPDAPRASAAKLTASH